MVLRPAVLRAFKQVITAACGAVGVPAAASSPLGTLVWRPTLYRRNAVPFVSLRAWRRSSRRADIQALKQAKAKANVGAAVITASEVAGALAALFGSARELLVSAAPCGHSRRPDCFGKRLAIAAAMEAGGIVSAVARRPLPFRGKSSQTIHEAQGIGAIATTDRATDIVDDLATAGWHMEESLMAVRAQDVTAFGVVWICGMVDR